MGPTRNWYRQASWQMSQALTLALGALHTPVSNSLFSVEDPDSVWVLQSGRLDVSVVPARNGEPVGARRYVLSVGQGEAIFGVGSHFADAKLMASATPETTVLVFSQ